MKLNFGKKLVLFLHWLIALVACALALALCVWPDWVQGCFNGLYELIGKPQADILGIALLAVYAVLAVSSVIIIFSGRRGDRGFITVDSSDTGRTRIAVGAVEQMIRQAVRGVDGIAEMKSNIVNNEDAISINVNVAILSGAHVPTVTMNIQRAIRSYIELNCGVAVREVCVSVHALEAAGEDAKHGRRGKAVSAEAPSWKPPIAPADASGEEAAKPDQPVEVPEEAIADADLQEALAQDDAPAGNAEALQDGEADEEAE